MNTKKKILFLVTQSEFGGAQRFIYRLITNLDLSKYDILIAAGSEGNDADGLLFNLRDKGFKVFPLKFLKRVINPVVDFCGFSEIYRLIKKEKPDILFLCSTKAGILGSLANKFYSSLFIKNSRPFVIYRIGGWTFNDPWPNWKRKLYVWLEKNTARFKDLIVNNAESDRQQAITLGIKPRREIVTIYNGIDLKSTQFLSKEQAQQDLKIRDAKFTVGTVANFYPPKGLEYLIEAANILKDSDVKFIIVGEGQERVRLENIIGKYNLRSIFLIGALPEAWKYLKAFDIFVLPSVKEGFPWTLIEAMAAGVPVVATRVGAVPEIIKNNENGILIEPRDPKIIADSIERLMNDKNLVEKFTQNGRKVVEDKFSLEQMVNSFENLFNNL